MSKVIYFEIGLLITRLDNILISFAFISVYTVFLLFYTLVTRADLM